jgi:(2Fe-2S) ferredoxin
VIEALRKEIAQQGLTDSVQVTICGSLGLCEHGPNMVVYPEGIWYSGITEQDVPEIVRSHFGEGAVVERLARIETQELRAEILSNREKMLAAMRAKDAAGVLPDDLATAIRSYQDPGLCQGFDDAYRSSLDTLVHADGMRENGNVGQPRGGTR